MKSQDTFPERCWLHDTEPVADRPWGMLFNKEAAMLYFLARDYFNGLGQIVDAGAFLGASSYCLAKGLEHNPRVNRKSGLLHAFDQFEIWSEGNGSHESMAETIRRDFNVELGDGETFIHVYTKNLGNLCRHVRIHAGDFMKSKWDGRPIEILFIDICKTRGLLQHLVATMYRSLIPGVSIVIHQDYHHPLLPWIHIAQEKMARYFETIEEIADTSLALRLVEPIPDTVLCQVADFDFSTTEQLYLMDNAMDRIRPEIRHHVALAKCVLLFNLGKKERAFEELSLIQASDITTDLILENNISATKWHLGFQSNIEPTH